MAGIRHAAAAAVDADVTQLLTDLQAYFALQQTQHDVDVRATFVAWFHGQLVNLDKATAMAARYTNRESPGQLGSDAGPIGSAGQPIKKEPIIWST